MASSQYVQTSRLLTIPGEICNRIYEIATNADDDKRQQIGLYHTSHWRCKTEQLPSRDADWSAFQRGSLGHLQTCRQLCAEFYPLHQGATYFRVSSDDLRRYLKVFVHDVFLDVALAQGHIAINPDFENHNPTLPAMLLCRKAERLRIELNAHWSYPVSLGDVMFQPKMFPKWHQYITETADCVSVQGEVHEAWEGPNYASFEVQSLVVRIKREFLEDWMDERKFFRTFFRKQGSPRSYENETFYHTGLEESHERLGLAAHLRVGIVYGCDLSRGTKVRPPR